MPKYITVRTKYTIGEADRDDLSAKIPLLEFAVGSLGLSRKQALIELGFPEGEIDRLQEERLAEDVLEDPAIRNWAGKQVIKDYVSDLAPNKVKGYKKEIGQSH